MGYYGSSAQRSACVDVEGLHNALKSKGKPKTIRFTAHADDRQTCTITDENDNDLLDHHGYAPKTSISDGDDIELSIDIETGKVLNWNPQLVYALLEKWNGDEE